MQPVFETLCAIGLYRKARLARNRYLRRDLWERAHGGETFIPNSSLEEISSSILAQTVAIGPNFLCKWEREWLR